MEKAQQRGQRVGVFVDVQNMYYSARHNHNAKVNFKAVLDEAVQKRVLIRAFAYVIRTEDLKNEPFFEALEKLGFEVRAKDLQIFYGGAKKGDWDVGIAMDAIELAPKLDTVILVSGDGDFVPLVEHLRRALGCRVEALAFGKSTSGKLREAVDHFTDLDIHSQKFLIKRSEPRTRHASVEETKSSGYTQNPEGIPDVQERHTPAQSRPPGQRRPRRRVQEHGQRTE